jgi:hypothetical protein
MSQSLFAAGRVVDVVRVCSRFWSFNRRWLAVSRCALCQHQVNESLMQFGGASKLDTHGAAQDKVASEY